MHVTQGRRELLGLLCGIWLWVSVAESSPPTPTGQSREGPPLQFRLAGYPRKHNEGRIEVFYNQEWGTICDDDFTLANAHVLCRHLGFVAATGWTHSAKYGKGSGECSQAGWLLQGRGWRRPRGGQGGGSPLGMRPSILLWVQPQGPKASRDVHKGRLQACKQCLSQEQGQEGAPTPSS